MTKEIIDTLSSKWSNCTVAYQIQLMKRYDRNHITRERYSWFQFLAHELDATPAGESSENIIHITEEELFIEEMEQALKRAAVRYN